MTDSQIGTSETLQSSSSSSIEHLLASSWNVIYILRDGLKTNKPKDQTTKGVGVIENSWQQRLLTIFMFNTIETFWTAMTFFIPAFTNCKWDEIGSSLTNYEWIAKEKPKDWRDFGFFRNGIPMENEDPRNQKTLPNGRKKNTIIRGSINGNLDLLNDVEMHESLNKEGTPFYVLRNAMMLLVGETEPIINMYVNGLRISEKERDNSKRFVRFEFWISSSVTDDDLPKLWNKLNDVLSDDGLIIEPLPVEGKLINVTESVTTATHERSSRPRTFVRTR